MSIKKYLCVSSNLIETIIVIINKHNNNDLDILKISIKSISEHLNIYSTETDIDTFIYEVAGKERIYIVKSIFFLFEMINQENKAKLLKVINIDENIFYYSNEEIEKVRIDYSFTNEKDKINYIDYLEDLNDIKYINEYRVLQLQNEGNFYYYAGSNSIIYIYDYITYDINKCLFKNLLNEKEWNIKAYGDYDEMMNILIQKNGEYVLYSDFYGIKSMQKKSIIEKKCSEKNKRITDIKNNLLKHINKKLEIENKLNFIEVNNGLKISLK